MKIEKINEEEIRYWLALAHIPGIGVRTLRFLQDKFSSLGDLFKAKSAVLSQLRLTEAVGAGIRNPPWLEVDKDLQWLVKNQQQHHILILDDENYPDILREINYPPIILYVLGDAELLNMSQLAMVGSRNPSHSGLEMAEDFAGALVRLGLVITSGLALGIDTACHKGTLLAKGKTIAVLGTGVDNIYPRRNVGLVEEILSGGGSIVSEFSLGTEVRAENFPRRNRIISGLSLGTLVVEATEKSGSLITAQYALEQGREVFAIPGSIHNPLVRGCHKLLRQGAKLVETPADILEELQFLPNPLKMPHEPPSIKQSEYKAIKNNLDSDYRKLLECIDYEMTSVDLMLERSGFSVALMGVMLTNLELQGVVVSVTGGYARKN